MHCEKIFVRFFGKPVSQNHDWLKILVSSKHIWYYQQYRCFMRNSNKTADNLLGTLLEIYLF